MQELLKELRDNSAEIRSLIEQIKLREAQGPVQTVIHKNDNGGFLTGVAIASCVATVFLMLAFFIVENRSYTHLDAQIDQLKAWSDIHSRDIARLQAQQPEGK